MDNGLFTPTCCFCPWASLPRRRRQCFTFSHSHDSACRWVGALGCKKTSRNTSRNENRFTRASHAMVLHLCLALLQRIGRTITTVRILIKRVGRSGLPFFTQRLK